MAATARSLARSVLMRNAALLKGTKVHSFESLEDPEWRAYYIKRRVSSPSKYCLPCPLPSDVISHPSDAELTANSVHFSSQCSCWPQTEGSRERNTLLTLSECSFRGCSSSKRCRKGSQSCSFNRLNSRMERYLRLPLKRTCLEYFQLTPSRCVDDFVRLRSHEETSLRSALQADLFGRESSGIRLGCSDVLSTDPHPTARLVVRGRNRARRGLYFPSEPIRRTFVDPPFPLSFAFGSSPQPTAPIPSSTHPLPLGGPSILPGHRILTHALQKSQRRRRFPPSRIWPPSPRPRRKDLLPPPPRRSRFFLASFGCLRSHNFRRRQHKMGERPLSTAPRSRDPPIPIPLRINDSPSSPRRSQRQRHRPPLLQLSLQLPPRRRER